MKCLTEEELHILLEKQSASLIDNRQISFAKSNQHLMVSMPEKTIPLNYFSVCLVDWFSESAEGVIYLSGWGQSGVSHPTILFEKLRSAYRETRPIIEAPAHLFDLSNQQEKAVMAGMIFLVMANDWDAYCFARSKNDYVYMGDEFVLFSTDNSDKIKEALETTQGFNLRRRERWVGEPYLKPNL